MNSLLSKLLAAGLIKKTAENNSSDGKSSGGGLKPPETPKKSEVLDMDVSEVVVSLFYKIQFRQVLLNEMSEFLCGWNV